MHEVLIMGLSMEQVGQRRNLLTQRWRDYFARRLGECLDRLALIYGFATERRSVRFAYRGGNRRGSACIHKRGRRFTPMWWFRTSPHFAANSLSELLILNHTRIKDF